MAAALALVLLFVAWRGWRHGAPRRNALSTHVALRTGMTLPEVIATARGPFLCTLTGPVQAAGSRQRRIVSWNGRTYRSGTSSPLERDTLSPAELRIYLDRNATEMKQYRLLHFTFLLVDVPERAHFSVALDDRGRLESVSEIRLLE